MFNLSRAQKLYYFLSAVLLAWLTWSFGGLTPFGYFYPPRFENTELALRWLCLFFCFGLIVFCYYLFLRRNPNPSWGRILLSSLIAFNVTYLFASVIENFFSGFESNFQHYVRNYKFIPFAIGISNLIAMILSTVLWFACYGLDRWMGRAK